MVQLPVREVSLSNCNLAGVYVEPRVMYHLEVSSELNLPVRAALLIPFLPPLLMVPGHVRYWLCRFLSWHHTWLHALTSVSKGEIISDRKISELTSSVFRPLSLRGFFNCYYIIIKTALKMQAQKVSAGRTRKKSCCSKFIERNNWDFV